MGGYDFDRIRGNYRFGPQRRMSAWITASTGGFFSGTRTEVGYYGRVELTPQLSIEPRISKNWVDLVEGSFTTTLLRLRATYALSSRSFVGALVQYNTSNSSLSTNVRFSLGVSAWKRCLPRLYRRPRHVELWQSRLYESSQPEPRFQNDPALPLLAHLHPARPRSPPLEDVRKVIEFGVRPVAAARSRSWQV